MPRFHDTIPDSCNPNLTDEQIGELVWEAQASISDGKFVILDSDDEIDAYVMRVMAEGGLALDQAG